MFFLLFFKIKKKHQQTKPNSGNDYQKPIIINSPKCILQSIIDKTLFP